MGAFSPVNLILLLVFWALGAAVVIFIIRYAINTSKLVVELREVKKELQLLREELSGKSE